MKALEIWTFLIFSSPAVLSSGVHNLPVLGAQPFFESEPSKLLVLPNYSRRCLQHGHDATPVPVFFYKVAVIDCVLPLFYYQLAEVSLAVFLAVLVFFVLLMAPHDAT